MPSICVLWQGGDGNAIKFATSRARVVAEQVAPCPMGVVTTAPAMGLGVLQSCRDVLGGLAALFKGDHVATVVTLNKQM